MTVTMPLWGRFSDLYGRRPIFLTGLTTFLVGSALSGASQNMGQLIAFRMVQGLGATPTVTVGDFLNPGPGDDTDGYWVSTATAAGAWFVITAIDTVRVAVEARMLF